MKETGLILITAFFVSMAWMFYVSRLNKDTRAAAHDAEERLNGAVQRAQSAEGVANGLHSKIVRAEAALNSGSDLPNAAQAARIILTARNT